MQRRLSQIDTDTHEPTYNTLTLVNSFLPGKFVMKAEPIC